MPPTVEEAARVAGAGRCASRSTVTPADGRCRSIGVAAVLVFFLGFELFGLPLVLGDPEGQLVLVDLSLQADDKLGTPSYQLMAASSSGIVAMTLPLVIAAAAR